MDVLIQWLLSEWEMVRFGLEGTMRDWLRLAVWGWTGWSRACLESREVRWNHHELKIWRSAGVRNSGRIPVKGLKYLKGGLVDTMEKRKGDYMDFIWNQVDTACTTGRSKPRASSRGEYKALGAGVSDEGYSAVRLQGLALGQSSERENQWVTQVF